MRCVLETGEPSAAAEAQRVTKDGRTVWVARSSSPVRDNIGQTIGLLDTLMDVTLLRQLDEESRALAQARERELIAMDLHDGLIQSLYALVLNLGAQERVLTTTQAEALQVLKNGRAEVERVIEEARTYVLNLRSRQFTPRDLAAGLKLLADGLRLNAGIEVRVSVDPSAQTVLQPEVRGHVLYLVREAVSNVLRHAEASEVEISLRVATGAVVVHVVDNGRGFEPPRVTRERQHGLHTMAERAHLIGGQLTVDGRPGGGTRVCLELPLEHGGRSAED
jgi:signal transduction histidine kinase